MHLTALSLLKINACCILRKDAPVPVIPVDIKEWHSSMPSGSQKV
jgi:hypothetical protein